MSYLPLDARELTSRRTVRLWASAPRSNREGMHAIVIRKFAVSCEIGDDAVVAVDGALGDSPKPS